MRLPVSRILVINDETLVLREFVKGLNAAAKSLDNPLGIVFTGITTARDALKAIEEDGDIQAVIVDDTLYTLKNNGGSSRALQMSALELVQKITRFRPELDVYILIAQEQEDEVVDALFSRGGRRLLLSRRARLSRHLPHSQCADAGEGAIRPSTMPSRAMC